MPERQLRLKLLLMPWWALAFLAINPVAIGTLWSVSHWRAGNSAWADFFGLMVAVGAAVIVASLVLKAREGAGSSNPIRPPGLLRMAREAHASDAVESRRLVILAALIVAFLIGMTIVMVVLFLRTL
jgi:hypothetical protein